VFRLTGYVLKSLWRHRARTALTVSGAAVAMLVYCFVASVQAGLENLTATESSRRTLVVFQENRFCPASSRLPEDYVRQIAALPGVERVVPVQVWTNNCRASLDIVVFNGLPADQLRSARSINLVSGSLDSYQQRSDAALVGRQLAARRGLKTGDQFSIGELSVHVAGVFQSAVRAEENLAFTSLQFLQLAPGVNAAGVVTQLEVALDANADPEAMSRLIDSKLSAGPVRTTTRSQGAFQTGTLGDLVDLIGFAHWLGYGCLGLVLALVATTTVMSVQDRIREHAVLQVIGVRPSGVLRLVLAESLVLCVAGGSLGAAVALLVLGSGRLAVGAEGVTIAFAASWGLGLQALLISAGLGLLAGLPSALQAAGTPILTALRENG
jgi:putative ABC transport system permease protein